MVHKKGWQQGVRIINSTTLHGKADASTHINPNAITNSRANASTYINPNAITNSQANASTKHFPQGGILASWSSRCFLHCDVCWIRCDMRGELMAQNEYTGGEGLFTRWRCMSAEAVEYGGCGLRSSS